MCTHIHDDGSPTHLRLVVPESRGDEINLRFHGLIEETTDSEATVSNLKKVQPKERRQGYHRQLTLRSRYE